MNEIKIQKKQTNLSKISNFFKERGGKIFRDFGKNYILGLLDDPIRFKHMVEDQLGDLLRNGKPDDLIRMYEGNVNITDSVQNELKDARQKLEMLGIDPNYVKQKINEYKPMFNREWLVDYLELHNEEFYESIMNRQDGIKILNWLETQISSLISTALSII